MSGLGSRLVNFFEVDNARRSEAMPGESRTIYPWSINDFLNSEFSTSEDHAHLIWPICERLSQLGVLQPAGDVSGQLPIYGSCYYTSRIGNLEWWHHENYGVFDNLIFGFPYIRSQLEDSVKPIIVEHKGDQDIGSCFILEDSIYNSYIQEKRLIITARHCIEEMSNIHIPGVIWSEHPPLSIQVHSDESVDLAIIRLKDPTSLAHEKGLRMSTGNVLDEVMVMGFPPIPGFESIQIAEVATIASQLKFTVGQTVASSTSYLDQQRYHLISARIKGESSGGPVVNKAGLLVGIVASHPLSDNGNQELDQLGFGLATPSERLFQMIKEPAVYSRVLGHRLIDGKLHTNI
jgi:serine protease Do